MRGPRYPTPRLSSPMTGDYSIHTRFCHRWDIFKCEGLGDLIINNKCVCVCVRDEDAPAKIEDPDALKPEGWLDDEAEFVPDPNAEKPEDW